MACAAQLWWHTTASAEQQCCTPVRCSAHKPSRHPVLTAEASHPGCPRHTNNKNLDAVASVLAAFKVVQLRLIQSAGRAPLLGQKTTVWTWVRFQLPTCFDEQCVWPEAICARAGHHSPDASPYKSFSRIATTASLWAPPHHQYNECVIIMVIVIVNHFKASVSSRHLHPPPPSLQGLDRSRSQASPFS
jgi:hypothetical protein